MTIGLRGRLTVLAPTLAAAAFVAVFLHGYDTPLGQALWYVIVFLFSVTCPGTLVYRAILGSQRSLLADLSLGTAVGVLLNLSFWFVFVGLGVGGWLLAAPLLVYALFLVVPGLRRHWRTARPVEPTPVIAAWGLAGASAAALVVTSEAFALALPPAETDWYQDQYWHLGNSARFLTHVTSLDMRVAGEPLVYHWFSNAHIAAQSLATGIDLTLVFARLWLVPILIASTLLMATVGRQLTGSWSAGCLAALMLVLSASIKVFPIDGIPTGSVFASHSPSQTFSILVLLLLLSTLILLWQRQQLPLAGWVLLFLTMVAAPGAKSSLLPVLVCGLALGTVVTLLRRGRWLLFGIPLLLSLTALVITMPFLGGGGAGIKIQLFSTIRRNDYYAEHLQLTTEQQLFPDGPVLPGLTTHEGLIATGTLLVVFAAQLAWTSLAVPRLREDSTLGGAAWTLLGIGIAGWSAMMLVDQDGMSQVYFFNGAVLALYLLAVWGYWHFVVKAWDPSLALHGTLAGVLATVVLHSLIPVVRLAHWPVAVASVVLLGALIVIWAGFNDGPRRDRAGIVLGSLLLAACLIPGNTQVKAATVPEQRDHFVTVGEAEAALWLRENSSPDDVLATNVHCVRVTQEQPCDNRSFWVSAFTQRAVLIEGWAYTDAAHQRHGENGLIFAAQPFPDQELFALNEAVFQDPTPENIQEMRDRGVRWLFASDHRGGVSPRLAELAPVAFQNGDVIVLELGSAD